jgi:hypothetical protein
MEYNIFFCNLSGAYNFVNKHYVSKIDDIFLCILHIVVDWAPNFLGPSPTKYLLLVFGREMGRLMLLFMAVACASVLLEFHGSHVQACNCAMRMHGSYGVIVEMGEAFML